MNPYAVYDSVDEIETMCQSLGNPQLIGPVEGVLTTIKRHYREPSSLLYRLIRPSGDDQKWTLEIFAPLRSDADLVGLALQTLGSDFPGVNMKVNAFPVSALDDGEG